MGLTKRSLIPSAQFTSCPDLSPRATRANKAAYAVKELSRQYSLPSATARVSTTTMATVPSQRLGDLGNMLKDQEKGKQAEGKACIKAQDKRKSTWDCGKPPLQDTEEGKGDKAAETG